jgi:hypothetical protein
MPRIRTIERGIVLFDFSNITDTQAALSVIAEARAFVQMRPRDGTTLLLTDVTGSTFNQAITEALRKLAADNKPYARASAIYGVTPLMRVLLRAIVALTGRDIRIFAGRAEAVAYLAAFNAPASAAPVSPRKP